MTLRALAGLLVGGAGRRMGGAAKGLLPVGDGRTVVGRWRDVLRRVPGTRVVLVGRHPAYAALGLETIDDDPPGIGPLGGLAALLARADSEADHGRALAFAGDMPFVEEALVERLLATHAEAAILAPRRGARWEPLCARYDAARVLPIVRVHCRAADHSLQHLLDEVGATELPLLEREVEALRDWDTPEDVARRSP